MNETKFTGLADIYAACRPGYPEELLDYLYTEAGFRRESRVADIGAGTGIFSERLAWRGSSVICVEPNLDMLSQAEEKLARYPNCVLKRAAAEETGLPDSYVDHITVAQAFHWFDRERFRAECCRILKVGGRVALVWNTRDASDALSLENAEINRRFCPDFRGFAGGSGTSPEDYQDFFDEDKCVCKTFDNDLSFDEQAFVGRSLSASYAPRPGSPGYDAYVAALRALFRKYSRGGVLQMKNAARLYIGRI